jgi:O-antigen/teichoic acid export membrane protein
VVGVPLAVAGALWAGLAGAVWALIVQTAVGCALGQWALNQETAKAGVKMSFALGLREWSMLWCFTLPVFLSTLLATPAGWYSRTLLVNQPGGYGEAALVSAANQWMNLVNFLPYTMGGVLVPIFANLYATHRRAEFMNLLRQNLLLNAGVALAVAVPLMLLAPVILGFYGPGFGEGLPIFILTMIAGVFIAINNLFSRAMQSAGKAWIDLASNGLWGLVIVAASRPLVHHSKGFGLVAAHTLAAFALILWQWVVLRRFLMRSN